MDQTISLRGLTVDGQDLTKNMIIRTSYDTSATFGVTFENINLAYQPVTPLSGGTHTVFISARDHNKNISQAAWSFIVASASYGPCADNAAIAQGLQTLANKSAFSAAKPGANPSWTLTYQPSIQEWTFTIASNEDIDGAVGNFNGFINSRVAHGVGRQGTDCFLQSVFGIPTLTGTSTTSGLSYTISNNMMQSTAVAFSRPSHVVDVNGRKQPA
jgi:hypothetical protein